MPNLFNDIDRLTTNDIRMELALIRNINLTNMAKETGNKMVGALARMASSLIQTVSQNSSVDYEVVRMSDVIRKEYDELAGMTRDELKESLKSTLMQRFNSAVGTENVLSEERVSYLIVSEAARMYDIPRYASFANKIHNIGIYYNKDVLQALHEMIRKQSPEEAEEFDQRLQKRLDIISLDAKRDLSQRLFPKEFSGRGIARVLRLERHTQYLEIAVSIMGIECFDYISAYAYTAAVSLRGFNKISRSVYAQFIWKIYGMTEVSRDNLPSYANTVEAASIIAKENKFRQMLKNRIEADKEIEKLRGQFEKNGQDKEKILEKLTNMQESYDNARLEFGKLEKDKDVYMSGVRPEPETKKYYAQVNAVKRQIDTGKTELEATQKKYTELLAKGLELDKIIQQKEVYSQRLHQETNKELLEKTQEIKKKWNEFYTSIIFDDSVYGQAVLAFAREELLNIEGLLVEFMGLSDKSAFDNEAGVIYCNTSEHTVVKIYHEGKTITSISR